MFEFSLMPSQNKGKLVLVLTDFSEGVAWQKRFASDAPKGCVMQCPFDCLLRAIPSLPDNPHPGP